MRKPMAEGRRSQQHLFTGLSLIKNILPFIKKIK